MPVHYNKYNTENPGPVPLPENSVVKNGPDILTFSSISGTLSETVIPVVIICT
jgi:hypothetical protein